MIKISKKHLIHTILGHSYLAFVLFFCGAIFFDQLMPFARIDTPYLEYVGTVLVVFGTVLICWAQVDSQKSLHERHQEVPTEKAFFHGPYKFIRTPTQVGLFFLFLGLGFTLGNVWVIIFSVISIIVNFTIFVKQQEHILTKRYGESYTSYKAKVHF